MKKSLDALSYWTDKLGIDNFYTVSADGEVKLQGFYKAPFVLKLIAMGFNSEINPVSGFRELNIEWEGVEVKITLT